MSRPVPANEAERIRQSVQRLLQQRRLTSRIKSFTLEFGEDLNGQPAVWISFFVEESPTPSSREITMLNKLASSVTSSLLEKGINYWPYVVFREPESRKVSRGAV